MQPDPKFRTLVVRYKNPNDVPQFEFGEFLGGECTGLAVGDLMSDLEKAEALLNEIDPYIVQEAQERLDAAE